MATSSSQPALSSVPDGGLSARVVPATDVGMKRQHNEDNYLVLPLDGSGPRQNGEVSALTLKDPGFLVAVADGMGGHHGGEVASRVCVETLAKEILPQLQGSDAGDSPSGLQQAVVATHRAVFTFSQEHAGKQTMGTTLTAALVRGARADVAQVGDSRAYLFREGNLMLLTQDQTIGNRLRLRGGDPDMVSPQIKELLTQALGAQAEIDVVMSATDLEPGDLLLLCSDGLYKVVPPEEVVEILEREIPLDEKAHHLIAQGNEHGGPDNITAILVEISQAKAAS